MKKAFCLILCLISCLFAFGCGGLSLDMNLSKDDVASWSYSGTGYEKSVFDVVRKDDKGNVLGSGTLTLTLDKDEQYSTTSSSYSSLVCEFSFTQNDITDTITSKAVFDNKSVYTVYSEKTVDLQSDKSKSYKFTCDYLNDNKVTYYIGGSETPVTLSTESMLSAYSGAVYDNESLYYVARAFNADSQQMGNFALTNLYDCYLSSNVNAYKIYYRTETDLYLTNDDFKDGKLSLWGYNNGKLPTYQVNLSIDDELSGPPVKLWYTDPDVTFKGNDFANTEISGNKKVLVKIMTTSYNVSTGATDYTTTYTLSEYDTVKK